ncbi:MAG TPA: AAA family ATPase [Nevskiaceae bacterium]|nr:AAA family ATPase [Nevskiaceae bacterium]
MAPTPLLLRFDRFELDEANARLTRDGKALAIAPKAFNVLCALARQPGQLMSKDALLDAVWGHQHVSESVLKTIISELRDVLGDDPKAPRYIETASRRGYRFIGVSQAAPPAPAAPAEPPPRMTGRQDVLAVLRERWQQALAGKRQVVWITGDAGVGKTTLIRNLLAEVGAASCSLGQCVEQFGAAEPYMPVLEALTTLCQRDPDLPKQLRTAAPTWLLQLPQFCSESERTALRSQLAGTNQDRMMRELRECLDTYTQARPLLLITEDLHWSDPGTLQLMNYLARSSAPARMLWLASFRLTEVIAGDHPLSALRHELRLQNRVTEIPLETFSEAEVSAYFGDRFPGVAFTEDFLRTLHAHTDGLPLFVANVVDELESQGGLGTASAIKSLAVPESLAGVIEKQLVRLPRELRAMLEAAAACGIEMRAQTVADALQIDAAAVSAEFDALAARGQWLDAAAVTRLADGSFDARYGFRHALYRQVLYQRLGAVKRAQLHARIAQSMEASRKLGILVPPAELALHYESSHDLLAALRHSVDAIDVALKRFAPTEALSLSAHALEIAPKIPESPERLEYELRMCGDRGVAASQLLGVGSPEAREAFQRAQDISMRLPPAPARASEQGGLGWIHFSRGEYEEAGRIAHRLESLADARGDLVLRMVASNLGGFVAAHLGDLERATPLLERGVRCCLELGPRLLEATFIVDPEVSMRANLSLPLSHLGHIAQAKAQIAQAMARARIIEQPMATMWALWWAAALAWRLGDVAQVENIGERLQATVASHSLAQGEGPGLWLRGWALARRGKPDEGHAMILRGHERHARLGMHSGQVSVLGYATEALVIGRRWREAQRQFEDARVLAQRIGERIYLPDLLVLQGRIAQGLGDLAAARAAMRASADEAHAQSAYTLERAALEALCALEGASKDDQARLEAIKASAPEGFDVA